MGVIEGAYGPILNHGAPVAGTSEVETITISGIPTGGTFSLSFDGFVTAPLAYNASAAQVQTALQALASLGTDVTVAGAAGGPYTVTFSGNHALALILNPIAVSANLLTGGTNPSVAVAITTPGVNVTGRGAGIGALLIDTVNANLYINAGTPAASVWKLVTRAA